MIRSMDELPIKATRILHPKRISLTDFLKIKKSAGSPSWGSVLNNPCNVYTSDDGRMIEEYGCTGLPSIFIEDAKGVK